MKVLVCGGRDFTDRIHMNSTLNWFHSQNKITLLIHGDQRGADRMAKDWAISRNVPFKDFPANWTKYGKRFAGPIRNKQMLDEGQPDLVIAFEGDVGTANMVTQAKKRKVRVEEV